MHTYHAVIDVAAKPVLGARNPEAWIGTADVRSSDGSKHYFVVFSEEHFASPEAAKDYARRMVSKTFEDAVWDFSLLPD